MFRAIYFVIFIVLVSCVPNESREWSAIVTSRVYSFPTSYADHRSQQQRVATKYGKVAFTDHGLLKSKHTIVMLHGTPLNSWSYRKVIPALQKKYRVVSIDLLGYGSSEKPEGDGQNYSVESQAEVVRIVLKSIGVKRYSIMMHDMGSLVSWELLRRNSDSVNHLIVLNSIVTKEGFNHPRMDPGGFTKGITKAMSSPFSSSAVIKLIFSHMGLTGAEKLSSHDCKGYVTPLKEGSSDALYAFHTSLNPKLYKRLEDNKAVLNAFKGETLVLWGGEDKNLTTKQIPYLQAQLRIPDEKIHVYPSRGHLLTEEIPQEVVNKVSQFLN